MKGCGNVKLCKGCNEVLPLDQFNQNSRSKDGLDWRCTACRRVENQKYIHSDKGKEKRKEYYEKTKSKHFESKRNKFAAYVKDNPEKVRARLLIGNAVRRGYIPKPEQLRTWQNRWEFHHPDHSRPFYGVWVTPPNHRLIDLGELECPPCTDYSEIIKSKLLADWGLA